MEEFWKNICIASFHDQRTDYLSNATHYASRAIILQDFLAKPFSDDPTPPVSAPRSRLLSSAETPSSSFLSLSSGSGCRPTDSFKSNPQLRGKKRSRETDDSAVDQKHERLIKNRESAARSRARKHVFLSLLSLFKGLIYNLTGSVLQAYTNKLELEVARLQEENAELRREQEKMCVAATTRLPQKKNLYRTLTAPF